MTRIYQEIVGQPEYIRSAEDSWDAFCRAELVRQNEHGYRLQSKTESEMIFIKDRNPNDLSD